MSDIILLPVAQQGIGLSWVTWALVLVSIASGWVIYLRTGKRSKNHSLYDQVVNRVEDTEVLAVKYWIYGPSEDEKTDEDLSWRINRNLSLLESDYSQLSLTRFGKPDRYIDLLMVFRQEITSGLFQSHHRKALTQHDPRIADINVAADLLRNEASRLKL